MTKYFAQKRLSDLPPSDPRSAMDSLFPPTPPDSSPVAGPGGQQRNTSSTYRSGVGIGRNGSRGYNAAEDEAREQV